MKLTYKLFLPIALVLIVTITAVSWVFISHEIEQMDREFEDQIATIAVTSVQMVHSFAEDYAEERGLRFHRVFESGSTVPDVQALEEEAWALFAGDPDAAGLRRVLHHEGQPWMYLYVPARLEANCAYCHGRGGGRINLFPDASTGDLVALFGVSGSMEELMAQRNFLQMSVVIVAIMVLLLISTAIHFSTRTLITRPVDRIVASAERIAEGDLTIEAPVQSNDEIGRLALAFNGMVYKLKEAMFQVNDTSNSVASASAQISASAEQMAAGAREQSSQTTQVAAAVEEMSATILENSRNAANTSETARQAKETAEAGYTVVNETIEGMKRIAEVVRQSATTVDALGESTSRIGNIVSVIDEIADQTNLLALNAAIEAARAGEQGRGFAVVADEVRALAKRTSDATKEIADMIRKIQDDTGGVVRTMRTGTEQVDDGIALADQAGRSLQEIVDKVDKVAGMIVQIAAATEEQSAASEEIASNVEEISLVTHQTAGATDQVARAAEELNRLTESLRELVNRFELGATQGGDRSA